MIRNLARAVLGTGYAAAGVLHLTLPAPFLKIVPAWVPAPSATVALTGLAELAGASALLQPWRPALRRAGAIGLALYALAVWPANFQHFALDRAAPDGGLGPAYHVPRLLAQPLLIWLALWAGEVTAWPLRRRNRSAQSSSSLPATP